MNLEKQNESDSVFFPAYSEKVRLCKNYEEPELRSSFPRTKANIPKLKVIYDMLHTQI